MRKHLMYLPELALIGATRGMLGFGIGLLVANRIPKRRRRIVGTALAIAGAISTIPLAVRLFRRSPETTDEQRPLHPPGDQPQVRRPERAMTH